MTISETSQSTSSPPVAKPRSTRCLELDVSPTEKQTTEVKKKSKRHRKDVDSAEKAIPQALIEKEKKLKKRKREAERLVDEYGPEEKEDSRRKAKKKVKCAEEDSSGPTTTFDVIVPAKKRKNKTGFLDPNEDASLSEQSKKCQSVGLAYSERLGQTF